MKPPFSLAAHLPSRDLRRHKEVQGLHRSLLRGQDIGGAGNGSWWDMAEHNEGIYSVNVSSHVYIHIYIHTYVNIYTYIYIYLHI